MGAFVAWQRPVVDAGGRVGGGRVLFVAGAIRGTVGVGGRHLAQRHVAVYCLDDRREEQDLCTQIWQPWQRKLVWFLLIG